MVAGNPIPHSAKGYTPYTDPGAEIFNGGSRAIAFVDELSEQEKEVYATKLAQLHKKANFAGSTLASFSINFNQNKYDTTVNGKKVTLKQDLKTLGFEINSFGGYKSDGTSYGLQPIDEIGTGTRRCSFVSCFDRAIIALN